MAHKALVDGASLDVSGGRVLVDATAYGIKSGRTMINGVVYDILFQKVHRVTISGSPDDLYAYIKYERKKYFNLKTYELTSDGEIELTIYIGENKSGSISMGLNAYVKLNGETVQQGIGSYVLTTDAENITINFFEHDRSDTEETIYWSANITTS